MAKSNYSYKTRRNDALTNRMIAVFVLMSIGVFALLGIKNWLNSSSSVPYLEIYMKAAPWFPVLPFVLFALSLVYFIMKRKNGDDEAFKVFSSSFILSITSVLLVVSLFISYFVAKGYVPSIIFVILVSVLYFIAISLPGSYFLMTLFNALGAFSLYALNLLSPIDHRVQDVIARVVLILLSAALLWAFVKAHKNGGVIGGFKLMKPGADILPLIIAVPLYIVLVLLGMFSIGSYVLFDIIIGLETIVFALFYAIKMLK
ncbi:MAG: hypothetical protein IJ323_03420 [Clostridia bacterium]|nr:hypothetical protein [Clostridia bacterium]